MTVQFNYMQHARRQHHQQQGFSLIELMIALTLGVIISGGIIQVMVSNSVTDKLNRSIAAVQESGRFSISRLRSDLLETGRYDQFDPNLETSVDLVDEANFLQNHPIPLAGDFVNRAALGATEGAGSSNDELVISKQDERDCRGYKLGYNPDEEFYVVNQYYVEDNKLKCRGFDGRYLRGQRAAVGHNNHAGYTILDNVESFQVLYGIANNGVAGNTSGRILNFVTADGIAAEVANGGQVVALRIAMLLKGDDEIEISPVPSFKLLNEAAITPTEKRLFKQFETTIVLRNSKNFIRSQRS